MAVIIGMLGGPGSGKGTQCELLSQKFDLVHISVGDVLRQEMNRQGSPYAEIIRQNMMTGKIGPKEITIAVLKDHILRSIAQGMDSFILDGFPRNEEQCEYFEQLIGPITCLVVLDCPESVMIERLARFDRSRFDDNLDNIRRRIETFQKTTSKVIDTFQSRDKVHIVNSNQPVDSVRLQAEAALEGLVRKRAVPLE